MITNKKTFIKAVKKDFPAFIDDRAIIEEAEYKLSINGGEDIEFSYKGKVKLYYFKTLKNDKKRFI